MISFNCHVSLHLVKSSSKKHSQKSSPSLHQSYLTLSLNLEFQSFSSTGTENPQFINRITGKQGHSAKYDEPKSS